LPIGPSSKGTYRNCPQTRALWGSALQTSTKKRGKSPLLGEKLVPENPGKGARKRRPGKGLFRPFNKPKEEHSGRPAKHK